MLQFPGEWKFADVSEIPPVPTSVSGYFHDLLVRVAGGAKDEREIVESFKTHFGATARSSSHGWALSDLADAMASRTMNAVSFIDAMWSSIEMARSQGLAVPSAEQVNAVLRRNGAGFELRLPALVRSSGDAVVAAEPGVQGASERYVLGDLLGSGGFGHVTATRETNAAVFEYALKRLDPHPFIEDREKALARFRREVAVLQKLQHRGIVPFVDAGVDQEGRPYVVMPRIQGKNIRDWAEGRSSSECVAAMGEVLAALAYAHASDVLHRDLKPSNILVRESDGQPIVLDFGNAYVLDEIDGPSLTNTVVGSMGYFPPEVAANPKLRSPTQDVFAAAVILYEIVARHRPDPLSYKPLHSRFDTPAALDNILQRALGAVDQRPTSASQLRELLLETRP